MRTLIMFVVCLALTACATAQDLGAQAPVKTPQIYPDGIPNPVRQGSDTIATATIIPVLPYQDSGTTFGYNDDYDEICPYSGATAPDVVYKYICTADLITAIDLCGSAYDTKLYVYDAAMNLIACNDDFYSGPPCGTYVSRIENLMLSAGTTYYVIVDGYGDASGAYTIAVEDWSGVCPVDCPEGGEPEGEPPLADNYVDNWNGGCNIPGNPFQSINGNNAGEAILCGVSGWYTVQGNHYRDTDWYILFMGADGNIEIEAQAEYYVYIFELGPQECGGAGVLQQATGDDCDLAFMTISGYAPSAPVWFWVGPTVYSAPSGGVEEFDYVVWFSGLDPAVVTESTTWSTVKALYD